MMTFGDDVNKKDNRKLNFDVADRSLVGGKLPSWIAATVD